MAAPFTSTGYDGSVDEIKWSTLSTYAGGVQHGVLNESSWNATIVPNTDRRVSISAGTGSGKGITDVTSAPVEVTFDSQPSGTRYDMVVARRDWTTNTTSFAVVKGGTTKALPTRNVGFGSLDDQPLWLVPITNGQQTPGTPIDLRVFQGDGGAYARDELALGYLTRLGSQIRVGSMLWTRVLSPSSVAVWEPTVWLGKSAWWFPRAAVNATDVWDAGMGKVGLIAGAIPAAPAGWYEVRPRMSAGYIQNTAGATVGVTAYLFCDGSITDVVRADLGLVSSLLTPSFVGYHPGGDFAVTISHQMTAGRASLNNSGSGFHVFYHGGSQ